MLITTLDLAGTPVMKPMPNLAELFERRPNGYGFESEPNAVASVIREAIVTGVLGGGKTIKQDEIAKACGTSKAPVREALKGLEAEGLTQSIKNRGFVVAKMSIDEMKEIFQTRCVLEPLAMELAMPMITERDIRKAEEFIMKAESPDYADPSWTCSLNLRFHLSIYEPARTRHLVNMIKHAHFVSHRYVHAAYWVKGDSQWTQEQHREIIKACRSRDVDKAKELVKYHINDAFEYLEKTLRLFLSTPSKDVETGSVTSFNYY